MSTTKVDCEFKKAELRLQEGCTDFGELCKLCLNNKSLSISRFTETPRKK